MSSTPAGYRRHAAGAGPSARVGNFRRSEGPRLSGYVRLATCGVTVTAGGSRTDASRATAPSEKHPDRRRTRCPLSMASRRSSSTRCSPRAALTTVSSLGERGERAAVQNPLRRRRERQQADQDVRLGSRTGPVRSPRRNGAPPPPASAVRLQPATANPSARSLHAASAPRCPSPMIPTRTSCGCLRDARRPFPLRLVQAMEIELAVWLSTSRQDVLAHGRDHPRVDQARDGYAGRQIRVPQDVVHAESERGDAFEVGYFFSSPGGCRQHSAKITSSGRPTSGQNPQIDAGVLACGCA